MAFFKKKISRKRNFIFYSQIFKKLDLIFQKTFRNLFIVKNNLIKLGDFGIAISDDQSDKKYDYVGDEDYMSPEVKATKPHSNLAIKYRTRHEKSTDIW
jgi:hypothetical protein